ncbi:adenosylmethionine decarboxylase [Colwellia psychrerythraea]|uniref:S-adenosylmethionine decarboxylase proenzyme n=1 Tax=Colwellia psychrerythraea TaxID=28229 RepID=A0A099KWM9_COLPS|nr:adenosylmethionine decarboxylase [Colwellia psychrerythraea]KGJ95001.1 S-adenosylmethionine decarboxylase proenzyme [Colwellia psychrerythraea]
MKIDNKIPLYGFNNLTKSLSFSLYRVHYLPSAQSVKNYNIYINNTYNSQNLEVLLTKICHAIGGNVLNIASQDYIPQGASVTLMISEEAKPESLVAHLDKSHLCIHTYPEETAQNGIAIFRVDIELSTCGVISPLKVLDYVIEAFSADVVDIDYRVRGMTRDENGQKHFCDHDIAQISDHLAKGTLENYRLKDSVMTTHNLFHCKLARRIIDLNKHLFGLGENELASAQQADVVGALKLELNELFMS